MKKRPQNVRSEPKQFSFVQFNSIQQSQMASLPPQKRQRAPSPTGTRAETATRRPRLGQASKNVEASERSGLTSVEIERVAGSIPGMSKHFKVIEKIGEGLPCSRQRRCLPPAGTFSSVYKAVDLQHSRYTNAHWVSATNSLPFFCNAYDADEDARDSYRKMRFVALKKVLGTAVSFRLTRQDLCNIIACAHHQRNVYSSRAAVINSV
jgi:hypothetical protein